MSNAARGRAPACLDTHKLWHLLDLAAQSLMRIEDGLEALNLAVTCEHIDTETRRALDFIRIGMNHQAGDLSEGLEAMIKMVAEARPPMCTEGTGDAA